jgi:hypothetical protein
LPQEAAGGFEFGELMILSGKASPFAESWGFRRDSYSVVISSLPYGNGDTI